VESRGLRISKSEVSGAGAALDEHVDAFRTRPLEGRYPYLFLDAEVEKVRDGGRVVDKALMIAHGVHESGRRGDPLDRCRAGRDRGVPDELPRGLVKRGLVGVQLAVSDARGGLKAAIAKVRPRLATQHGPFPQGLLRAHPQGPARPAGRADPPIFNSDSFAQARDRLSEAVAHLDGRRSKIASMLEDAEARHPRLLRVSASHWRKLRSTNPLERFNPRGRPAHRCRRHLPPRPLTHPARGDAVHRTE
jgi:transposase-like protein